MRPEVVLGCPVLTVTTQKRGAMSTSSPAKSAGRVVRSLALLASMCPVRRRAESWPSYPATLPPTDMEVPKGPFQEESSLSTQVCTSMLAGGRVGDPIAHGPALAGAPI